MGTRDATKADIDKLITGEWSKKPDLRHRGCSGGKLSWKNSGSFECTRCKLYWSNNRLNKWSEMDISERFTVETVILDQLHKLVEINGVTYCVPVDKEAENEPSGT